MVPSFDQLSENTVIKIGDKLVVTEEGAAKITRTRGLEGSGLKDGDQLEFIGNGVDERTKILIDPRSNLRVRIEGGVDLFDRAISSSSKERI